MISIYNSLSIYPPKKFFHPDLFEIAALSIYLALLGSPVINFNFFVVFPSGTFNSLTGIVAQPQLISKVLLLSTTPMTN